MDTKLIEIDKVSSSHKNYKYKILASFFLFSILVVITIIIVHIEFSKENNLKKFTLESNLQAKEKSIFLNEFLDKRKSSLLAVASNPYFKEFVDVSSYKYNTDFLFNTIMQENKEYMQLRFLDKDGMEKIRFDRKNYGEVAYKVNTLQDKSNRYYFQKAKTLKENEVFFSKIDFNMENGVIQKPYVPVIRVATPIYILDELKGVLIINIFAKKFLELLTSSPIYHITLLDNEGYVIKINDTYYDRNLHIKNFFKTSVVKKVMETKDKTIVFDENIFIQKINISNQSIFMVFKSQNKLIEDLREDDLKMTGIILLITFILSIPFAYILGKPIKEMFEIVLLQADKLHALATTLDKKVEIETLKNAKKDRLLQHQSKMAELGDMVGNIAHQWKHPLTRLSLLLQNLKLYKSKGKLSDEIFYDSLEKVDEQIEFMSDTIDNFRKFYKNDEKKKEFFISDAIKNVLKIVGAEFTHLNIDIKIQNLQNIKIYENKNQLSQVIMNLLVNAKDAILDKNIKSPYINIVIFKDKGVTIQIEDNAGGIALDIIDDIFEPYFTTKSEKGTGIGLYLCKTIIEDEMKGKLTVKNSSNGAIFIIELQV